MNATQITEYLDTELPNAKVFADLRDALAEVVEDDHFRDSQQNKCSSPRSLPSRLCGSDFSRQPKWNSLILESPLWWV